MRLRSRHVFALVLGGLALLSGISAQGAEELGIQLDTPVYFSSGSGEQVRVAEGSYTVQAASATAIRLIPVSGESHTVPAQLSHHSEELSQSVAVAGPEGEDAFYVVLFDSNGTRLDATGSLSGIAERGRTRYRRLSYSNTAIRRMTQKVYPSQVMVLHPPRIDRIDTGHTTTSKILYIRGAHLGGASARVKIGQVSVTPQDNSSDSTLVLYLDKSLFDDANRSRLGALTITTLMRSTYDTPPSVTEIDLYKRNSGPVVSHTLLIRGSDLAGVFEVKLGNLLFAPLLNSSSSQVIVDVSDAYNNPAKRAQLGTLSLRSMGGDLVPQLPTPVVDSVQSYFSPAGPGHGTDIRGIRILGSNLASVFQLQVGSLTIDPLTITDDWIYTDIDDFLMDETLRSKMGLLVLRAFSGEVAPFGRPLSKAVPLSLSRELTAVEASRLVTDLRTQGATSSPPNTLKPTLSWVAYDPDSSRPRIGIGGSNLGGVYDIRIGDLSRPPELHSLNTQVVVNVSDLHEAGSDTGETTIRVRTVTGDSESMYFPWWTYLPWVCEAENVQVADPDLTRCPGDDG